MPYAPNHRIGVFALACMQRWHTRKWDACMGALLNAFSYIYTLIMLRRSIFEKSNPLITDSRAQLFILRPFA